MTSETTETTTTARYRVVALATTLAMVTYLDRTAIGTLAPGISRDLGLTAVEMGWVFTVFQLAYAFSLFAMFFPHLLPHELKTMRIASDERRHLFCRGWRNIEPNRSGIP